MSDVTVAADPPADNGAEVAKKIAALNSADGLNPVLKTKNSVPELAKPDLGPML
jgi:hypothetical protein